MGLRDMARNSDLADPTVVAAAWDGGTDQVQVRRALREAALLREQIKTNVLLQTLIDLQRESLDAGRLR